MTLILPYGSDLLMRFVAPRALVLVADNYDAHIDANQRTGKSEIMIRARSINFTDRATITVFCKASGTQVNISKMCGLSLPYSFDLDLTRWQWSSGNMPDTDSGVRDTMIEPRRTTIHYDIHQWTWAAHPYCTINIAASQRALATYCYTRSSVIGLSVCLSVCLLVTFMSPAKAAIRLGEE